MFLSYWVNTPIYCYADLPFRIFDTGLRAQIPGSGSSAPTETDTSQYDSENLSLLFDTKVCQIPQANDLGLGWGSDLLDPSTDCWANPAASHGNHSEPGPQKRLQHLKFVQTQNTEIACFPEDVDNMFETDVRMGFPTECDWTENEVDIVNTEPVQNEEMESKSYTPTTSNLSFAVLDSSNSGESLANHTVSTPSSYHPTELSICDKVDDLESVIELPHVPHYDTCFGVVSHRLPTSGLKTY